nr:M14 family metallopeptidase [Brasilonema sp. UFV-L1]
MQAYQGVFSQIFIDEDFSDASGTTDPSGWTSIVIEGNSTTDIWRFDNPGGRTEFEEFLSNPFAIYDSDFLSKDNVAENIALVSPVFDASSASQIFLKFDQDYQGVTTSNSPENASKAFVEVYNGSEWQSVYSLVEIDSAVGSQILDISDVAAGVENAQVRFRFEGNWSYLWAVDNIQVTDTLTPGVRVLGSPRVSEDNVPDSQRLKLVLEKPPSSDVTINFTTDNSQLQSISPLTFTPDNWNIPQIATVAAVADGVEEGNDQTSAISVTVSSADDDYNGFAVNDIIASITDNTIPGFPSYRTVEKTYSDLSQLAANNPDIATWLDIGDSYDKITPGGSDGYDLHVLELTNKNFHVPGGKPTLYVQGGIHAREYTTNEVATRFGEYLVNNYGTNPDVTWLLDYFKIDINPVVNPDGRKYAEQGYSWRKNTNPNPPDGADPAPFPSYGVDLNRNWDFGWGTVPGGSSGDPTSDVYRGSSPASEPEVQAVQNFVQTLFSDQRGPDKNDPAPNDTTGVFIDLHSFSELILYPWGSTTDPAPNEEGLRNLGLKFGYYTDITGKPYDVAPDAGLYPADGTADEWAYGTLGVASYTWELGTAFFESNDYFENTIVPQIIPALLYAAKSARVPYQTGGGPDSLNLSYDPQTFLLTGIADDTRYADNNTFTNTNGGNLGTELPTSQAIASLLRCAQIAAVRYSIDQPSWIPDVELYSLSAADGVFDSPVESIQGMLDTSTLASGRHTLFVESQDAAGNWGVPSAVFITVPQTCFV